MSSEPTKDQRRETHCAVAESRRRTASRQAKIHLLLGYKRGGMGERRSRSAIRDDGRRPPGTWQLEC
jgi:hypothetical protein